MQKKVVIVQNRHGMHARPCSMLVKVASKSRSEFSISNEEMSVNVKSIMGVMMLAAACGSSLELQIEGYDEEEAMEEIIKLFDSKFGEET